MDLAAPPPPPRKELEICSSRLQARSPAGQGRGWAGRGAEHCAGRRERGGEDSLRSDPLSNGGRTCGVHGELTRREEGERGLRLPGSEETRGVQGSDHQHLLL